MADPDERLLRAYERQRQNLLYELEAGEADDDSSQATRISDGQTETAVSWTFASKSTAPKSTALTTPAATYKVSENSWNKAYGHAVRQYLEPVEVDGHIEEWATTDIEEKVEEEEEEEEAPLSPDAVREARAAERTRFYRQVEDLARAWIPWIHDIHERDRLDIPPVGSLVENPTQAEIQDFGITEWRQVSTERWNILGEKLPPSLIPKLSDLGFIEEQLPPEGSLYKHALLGGASLRVMFRNCCFLHDCCIKQRVRLEQICILAGANRKAQLEKGDALDLVLQCEEYQEHQRAEGRKHFGLVLAEEETEKSLADKIIDYFKRLYPGSHWDRATTLRADAADLGQKVWVVLDEVARILQFDQAHPNN